ncbi:sensor histidine kinase [Runella slithyformis]|uniref:Signal transduction histidine kinase n=1 Tax=Runella slithyformis (strain ATCC 29530 / DSM 19594 / LMG 11500 / NCIMB 11436 / LSU 4) TaxID=761193 RepID=A0A7U3ZMG8_RUNSL|nr:histidine kinase [Runella slithyformis]AEI49892.1 putative signal transduction histidine kinase [Runella slithyformis DSM 19594]
MNTTRATRISIRQKWQLALSVSVIYMPLRLYVSIYNFNQISLLQRLPLWMMELSVIVLFFFVWISAIEWIQQQLFGWFGNDFLIEFKIPAQLAMFVVACAMALIYNIGFRPLWNTAESTLETHFGITQNQSSEYTAAHQNTRGQRRKANNGLTIMALLSAFYLASNRRAYHQLEAVQLKAERLEKENVQAQFTALKNQVSPHFLFNNFSILTSLIETDPQLSVQFINRLSKAYRYILEQSAHERISLKTELDFIETYLFLLNTRFEQKLQVNLNLSEKEAGHYAIAPLTLQLLIENAVKHNRMSTEEPLTVSIYINEAYLIVSNPRQPRLKPEPSTRLGLQNIINRYKLLTDLPVIIEDQTTDFLVKIPLLP